MEAQHRFDRSVLPGEPRSLWIGTTERSGYPPLPGDVIVDAAVVGGGIVGLTAAFLLRESGASVALIEAGRLAEGVSGHTTAKLTSAHSLIYSHLINTFNEEKARQYADANQAAIEFVAEFISEHNLSCDFNRTFACTYALEDSDLKSIEAEVSAAGELGLPVFYSDDLPLPFAVKGAICYENQAFFHPRKYLLAMAEKIPGPGSYIFEKTRVTDIEEGSPCRVITRNGVIHADRVICATHFPILNRGLFFAKMVPSRSYLMAAKTVGDLPDGMYYSMENPFHTFRRHTNEAGENVLIIGGQHHEAGHESNTIERYRQVEAFARKHFNVESILYRWSAQDNRPVDRVPFIGRHSMRSQRLFVATGMQGWGMTNGTAAAMILSDMLAGRSNPWSSVYDPNRISSFVSRKFISRNIHVAKVFMQDYVLSDTEKTVSDLARGEGGVIERDGKKSAAYKDEAGQMHMLSPVCTHMMCKVKWNNAELSWDCPCHGSRFDVNGKVIHAPAVKDLDKEE